MVRGKLFSCRNQLLRQGMRWQIKLCQDDLVGAMLWGGSRFCGSKNMIIFQNIGQFSEKLIQSLIYCANRLWILKNYQVWSFVGGDLLLCDFIWLIFPSFSVERVTLKYFGKLLVDLIEFDTCKEICYLFIFLEI